MHTIRNLTLTIGLLFFSQLFFPQTTAEDLNFSIKKATGENKLELLFALANFHLDTDRMYEIARQIEIEALKQENMRYVAASYVLMSRFYSIKENMMDSVIYYSELAAHTYDDYNINNPGDSYLFAGTAYLRQGYYELAIYNIKRYMESDSSNLCSSYSLLAEAYTATRRYDMAKETILQVIAYFNQKNNTVLPNVKIIAYQQLVMINIASGEYHDALEACVALEKIFNEERDLLQESIVSLYANEICNLYAETYIKKGDANSAKKYLDGLQEFQDNEYSNYLENAIKGTWGEYYLLIGNYHKALACFDSALDYFKGKVNRKDIALDIVELKVKALRALNKYEEALILQHRLSQYNDSIYRINLPLQLSQLSKKYELERVRLERDKDKANLEKSKTINIGLVIVSLLFFVILCLVRRNAKKLRNKNRALYQQYMEVNRHLYPVNVAVPKEEDVAGSLFVRIESYMKEQQVYRQPNLTREDLAEMLNTNRGYLTDAIKAETGKTFLEYINDYRLNYARFKLMEDKSVPVIQIMYDCGFSSKSPFYRLFKDRFGMSPTELREVKIELEDEV